MTPFPFIDPDEFEAKVEAQEAELSGPAFLHYFGNARSALPVPRSRGEKVLKLVEPPPAEWGLA